MSDQNRQSKPSWKADIKGGRKNDARADWRKEVAPAPIMPQGWSWKAKAGTGLAGFIVLSAGLAYLIYLIFPPKVPFLVAVGAPYYANLSVDHNAQGWGGLRDLCHWCEEDPQAHSLWGANRPRRQSEPQEVGTAENWDKDLESNFREPTVVLFFSLHGGSDGKGAYLLRDEGRDTQPIRLEEILDRLAQPQLKDKNKVLILDVVHETANVAHGMLHNDFVRRLKDQEDRINSIPKLVVITSTSPDERSWASEEWGQTIFAHFVLEGLKGAADKDGNSRVSAAELFEYVRSEVGDWVQYNRNHLQTPRLFPEKNGLALAQNVILSVVTETYRQPPPAAAPGASFKFPAALKEAWDECDKLRKSVPAPAVYSPHLWRQYRDTLLRLEQLYRARPSGEEASEDEKLVAALGTLKQKAVDLNRQIKRNRTLLLTNGSDGLALPLPRALGLPRPPATDLAGLKGLFDALWADPKTNEAKWQEMRAWAKSKGPEVDRQLPHLAADLLLNRVLHPEKDEEPLNNPEKIVAVINLITDHGNQQPTEIHFLDMLLRDLDQTKRPPVADLRKAVELHRLAGETALATDAKPPDEPIDCHPYSEQVYPWIADWIEKADDNRRRGEDLLFSTQASDWEKTREFQAKAANGYKEAHALASVVRQALRIRDDLFAELPDYSAWLLRKELARDPDAFTDLQQLWDGAHVLADRLDAPRDQNQLAADRRILEEKVKDLPGRFERLRAKLLDFCQKPRDAQTPSPLLETEAALAVPLFADIRRVELLEYCRGTSQKLNQESLQPGKTKNAPAEPGESIKTNSENTTRMAQGAAARQGTLALAALGQTWFDHSTTEADREPIVKVRLRLENFPTNSDWDKMLAQAGDQIGYRWKAMVPTIRQAPTSSRPPLDDVRKALLLAESLCRQLPAAASEALETDPVFGLRRLRTSSLLVWQARRVHADHWAAFDPSRPPYYLEAVNSYLADAGALATAEASAEQKNQRLAEVAKAKTELPEASLLVKGDTMLNLTSERKFKVPYQVVPGKFLPNGYAVLWLNNGASTFRLTPEEEPKWGDKKRQVVNISQEVGTLREYYSLQPPPVIQQPYPKREEQTTALVGLFRGQKVGLEHSTTIAMHLRPNVVISEAPTPGTAALYIRADKSLDLQFAGKNSALTIILDCSGSMREKDAAGKTRFEKAVQALNEVMNVIEPGTKVSLWIFSAEEIPTPATPEDTIKRLFWTDAWDPNNPRQLESMMARIRKLHPLYATPLVRSLMEARQDLEVGLDGKIEGHRVMLVLTDGMDTRFENRSYPKEVGAYSSTGDKKFNNDGKLKIGDFLAERFKDSGIQIKIIGFELNDVEKALAREQFEDPVKNLQPPGEFFTTNKSNELKDALRRALKPQLRCQLRYTNGEPVPLEKSKWVDVPSSQIAYRKIREDLDPKKYELVVDRLGKMEIQLDAGDVMMVTLTRGGFQRSLFVEDSTNQSKQRKLIADKAGQRWILGVLQNELKKDDSVEMLVSLEQVSRPSREGELKQVKPDFVLFELQTKEKTYPLAVDWAPVYGYFAPAWKLKVKEWPRVKGELAKGILHAYWLSGRGLPVVATPTVSLPIQRQKLTAEGIEIDIQDGEVVPAFSSEYNPNPESALVVRLTHSQGKPVQVRLQGLSPPPSGAEHRSYSEARQYTGIFWKVTKDQAKHVSGQGKLALEIISLEGVKKLAKENGTHAELELRAPDRADTAPHRLVLPKTPGAAAGVSD